MMSEWPVDFLQLRSRILDEKFSPFCGVVVCTCRGDPELPCPCTSAEPDELVKEAAEFAEGYSAPAHQEALRQYYGLPI